MWAKIAISVLAAAGVACLAFVLENQYSSGGVYQEGSSLRHDLYGSSVLFEALARVHPEISRSYVPLENLKASGAAILILNLYEQSLSEAFLKTCETLAGDNGRVIIAFNPESYDLQARDVKRWNLRFRSEARSRQRYLDAGPEWMIMRREKGHPAALARSFGSGSIAIVTSSYPFTNVALRDQRDLELLSWAIADKQRIVFDESHLGSVEQTNIMGLARRFRLEGLIGVLLVAALLFIWRSSVTFPPELAPSPEHRFWLAGAGSSEGLRSLLARHLAPGQLLAACVAEWRRDRGRKANEAEAGRIEIIALSDFEPVRQWEEIRSILNERKRA